MWENAAPHPSTEQPTEAPHPAKPPKPPAGQGGDDQVFWAQLLLSLAALAVVLVGRSMGLPYFPVLRTALTAALEADDIPFLLNQERSFAKFTEQVAALWEKPPQTAETARIPHRKAASTVPTGCREQGYLPEFPLLFPLRGSYTLTSGYGTRTDPMGGQGTDYHTGNDYAAAQGTSVYAAADGVVRVARAHTSYGNYVRLLHAGGDETIYAHLQYLFVHSGQQVAAGECLGVVGETGNATGPHLHFELLHGGVRYDPDEALQNAR